MNIRFVNTRVGHLLLEMHSIDDVEIEEDDFKFSFMPAFSEVEKREFLIVFKVGLKNREFNLVSEFIATFSTDDDIDEPFKVSNFVKINAPAISYPFLRAFISNLTVNSGFQPVVLPTVNFINLEPQPSR